MSGIEGIRRLKQRYPGMLLVMLTVYDDDHGFSKPSAPGPADICSRVRRPRACWRGLREVVGGGAPMSPEVARRVVQLFREIRPPAHADYGLTPHEVVC